MGKGKGRFIEKKGEENSPLKVGRGNEWEKRSGETLNLHEEGAILENRLKGTRLLHREEMTIPLQCGKKRRRVRLAPKRGGKTNGVFPLNDGCKGWGSGFCSNRKGGGETRPGRRNFSASPPGGNDFFFL